MKRYAIGCLGCKVNTTEAEGIRQELNQKGYEEVSFREVADIYLILTCAVTNVASSKSRQKVNQAIRLNENAIIGVIGCYVQMSAEELKQNERIDILVGSSHKNKVPELIEKVIETKEKQYFVDDVRNDAKFEALSVQQFHHQTRAYLKIQDGCNQFCSYCVIPFARGKERSLPLIHVVENARKLSENHREIVLTGIHTGRYGQDVNSTLSKCIEQIIEESPKLDRLRISSIEATEIDRHLLEMMKDGRIIAKHLHIPLQSGSDAVLKRMNRPYTTEEFYNKITEIREMIPEISISTDLIVGFPQETEEEFEETVAFLKKCEFSFLHVFPFSAKDGTAAQNLNGHLSAEVKKKRVQQCVELSSKLENAYREKFLGKELDILVEKQEGKYSFGHSSEYIPVYIEGHIGNNQLVKVQCKSIRDNQIYAVEKAG